MCMFLFQYTVGDTICVYYIYMYTHTLFQNEYNIHVYVSMYVMQVLCGKIGGRHCAQMMFPVQPLLPGFLKLFPKVFPPVYGRNLWWGQ